MADVKSPTDMQSPEPAPKSARRFGPRWWLIAALAFAGISVVLSPVAMMLFWAMLLAVAFGGAPLPGQWLAAAVSFVIVPGLLSGGLATLAERTLSRSGRPDRANRWSWRTLVTVLVAVSPGVFLPVMFKHSLDGLGGTKEQREAMQHRARRPIAESDAIGFCSVPTWTVLDGHPELKIAVRVPERADYALMVQGDFDVHEIPSEHGRAWGGRVLTGMTIREMGPGVDTMSVKLGGEEHIAWPVLIDLIDLSRADGTGRIDSRSGDSLYVIDETGPRQDGH